MSAPASASTAVILNTSGGRLPLRGLLSRRRRLALALALRRSWLRLRRSGQLVAAVRASRVLLTALFLRAAVVACGLRLSSLGAGWRGFGALLEAFLKQRQCLEYLWVVHRVAQQPFLAAILQLATRSFGQVAPLARRRWRHIGEWRDALCGSATRQIADALARRADLGRRKLLVDAAAVQLDRDSLADDIDHHHLAGAVGGLYPSALARQLGLDLE